MKSLLLILTVTISAIGQEPRRQKPPPSPPCTITADKSPEVRGLKLGQPYQPVERERDYDIVGAKERPNEYNLRRFYLVNYLGQSVRLKGINRIELRYLDDKLAFIQINYSDDVKWQSSAHFASAIARQLGLPTELWVNSYSPTLTCDGFIVQASLSAIASADASGILTIQVSTLESELRKRQSALEQKKRVEFRP